MSLQSWLDKVYIRKATEAEAANHIEQDLLAIIGEDEKSKHVGRFQCPNYGNGCYEWAERWKMNSEPPYCSTDGRKMKYVEFDEEEGDDWVRNELRAELRTAITAYCKGETK